MNCPYCHREDTQVTDSRLSADGNSVKRRRRCKNCQRRFTTYETIGELVVQKLRELDEVAYIRFASVYRNFADLDEMREEMEGLQTEQAALDLVELPGPPEEPRKKGSAQA